MKTTPIKWSTGIALSIASTVTANAQTLNTHLNEVSQAVICKAECFEIADDGYHVYYAGLVENSAYIKYSDSVSEKKKKVFQNLKRACDEPHLLVKRTFKDLTRTSHQETQSRDEYDFERTRYSNRAHQIHTTYTFTYPETQAKFQTVDANEQNSCIIVNIEDLPAKECVDGHPIGG